MFTTTPEQYGSLYENQIFKFESTFIEDQTYVIKEVDSNEVIGVKKFYQTDLSFINVAPIVRPYAIPTPSTNVCGFIDSSNFGSVRFQIIKSGTVESTEVESDEFVMSLSKSVEDQVCLATTLDKTRSISMGESELILVRCAPNATISAVVKQYKYNSDGGEQSTTEDVSVQYMEEDDGRGFVLFSLCAERLGTLAESEDEIEKITVTINNNTVINPGYGAPIYASSKIDEVTYYLIDPPRKSMRLAWISSRGSIEHYTMPFIVSELLQSGSRQITLRSALESYSMRCSLAEVISAETIWVVEDGEYIEVELLDEQIELSPANDLANVQFKILYRD